VYLENFNIQRMGHDYISAYEVLSLKCNICCRWLFLALALVARVFLGHRIVNVTFSPTADRDCLV